MHFGIQMKKSYCQRVQYYFLRAPLIILNDCNTSVVDTEKAYQQPNKGLGLAGTKAPRV